MHHFSRAHRGSGHVDVGGSRFQGFGPGRWAGVLGAAAILVGLAAGCNRQAEESAPDASPAAAQEALKASPGAPQAPEDVQPQALQVAPDADAQAIVDELNRQLRRWVMSNQRKPESFEEFVSSAQIQVPPPPPGKKFILTKRTRIELVDR